MARVPRRSGPLAFLRPGYLLRSNATSKGLLGSSRGWRIVFGLIMAKRLWGKVMGSQPEVVAVDKLRPGQFMTIEAIGPKDKHRR